LARVNRAARHDGVILAHVMPKPTWFDWITVAAIVLGPILALFAQRLLDWMRERKERRVNLYQTVMSLRGTWLHPDSIRALNSIDTIFDKRGDKSVRDAWERVIRHACTPMPDVRMNPDENKAWNDRLLDLRVDLYQLLGAAVGYDHTIDYIKNQLYVPQYHIDVELEQMQIRKQFAKAITDDGLKVVVTQEE
jgi:hypothetical protein